MAAEYKLKFTAEEIERKLGKIEFDNEPTKGSENLLTSGTVYEALQNVGGESGGSVNLTAGDGIEIKDSVIRSTLGDYLGEIETTTVLFNSDDYGLEIEYDSKDEEYNGGLELNNPPPYDRATVDVELILAGSSELIEYNQSNVYYYEEDGWIDTVILVNSNQTIDELDEDGFVKTDETLPGAIIFWYGHPDEGYYIEISSYDDIAGASVSIIASDVESNYVRLPDNALKAGDLIEIKDGVISSTLGKTYTTVKQGTLFNSGRLYLEDSYIDEEDPTQSEYIYDTNYQSNFLNKPDVEDEWNEIDVKYYLPDSDEFVILKGQYKYYYDDKDEADIYTVAINARLDEEEGEPIIDNPDFPVIAVNAQSPYYYSKDDEWVYDEFEITTVSYGQDISYAKIVIDGERVIKTTVKLPREALDLTIDEELDKESDNPISNSAVYYCKRELEDMIFNNQHSFTFDDTPTFGSSNAVTSGGVYSAIQVVKESPGKLYYQLSKNAGSAYLSRTSVTSNKSTTYDVRINMSFGTTNNKQMAMNALKNYGSKISIIFSDERNKIYHIHVTGIGNIDDYSFYFNFSFASGSDTFPIDTDITSRAITELIIHYDYNFDWYGDAWFAGDIYIGGASPNDTNAKRVFTENMAIGRNGTGNCAEKFNAHAVNVASGDYSHAEGNRTTANGNYSHAEGEHTTASGDYSHAEGKSTIPGLSVISLTLPDNEIISKRNSTGGFSLAKGIASHVEGANCLALSDYSHAEGDRTTASGDCSHAEGNRTSASGAYSHAEGHNTAASGAYSHAEGDGTIVSGAYSHAEGCGTIVRGDCSHAEGCGTIAKSSYQHVQGKYNIEDMNEKYIHVVGNGISYDYRSNAHTLDWEGNAWYSGYVEGKSFILPSSTKGSTKRFKITVDDSGTLSVTEVTE